MKNFVIGTLIVLAFGCAGSLPPDVAPTFKRAHAGLEEIAGCELPDHYRLLPSDQGAVSSAHVPYGVAWWDEEPTVYVVPVHWRSKSKNERYRTASRELIRLSGWQHEIDEPGNLMHRDHVGHTFNAEQVELLRGWCVR
ncbi:MAG: hypothetical protein AAFV46_00080 [Cyanobacteria bacterium J06635_11]